MVAGALIALAAASAAIGQAAFEAALAENAAFRRDQFVAAGLAPVEEAAQQGRDVRRVRAMAWLPGAPPAMEIERHADGEVTLVLTWANRPAERHPLDASVWRQITALDDAVFEKPTYDLERIGSRPEGSVSCHGDRAWFEASSEGQVRTAGASQCYPRLESFTAAKMSVIVLFVRAAIATRPACAMDDARPARALALCFR